MSEENPGYASKKDAAKKLGKSVIKVDKAMERLTAEKGRLPNLSELEDEVTQTESEEDWFF